MVFMSILVLDCAEQGLRQGEKSGQTPRARTGTTTDKARRFITAVRA